MEKTRDFFKKIRGIKETFHANMGTIKDRNGMNLTEAEEIKKRWQEYTEELHKKGLNDPDNHDGVVIHLEPDILECKVKQASGSITTNKASGGGILAELFQILKDDIVEVLSGFSSSSLQALEHKLNSCGVWMQLLHGMWDRPGTGTEPMSPESVGGFFTTKPPKKPYTLFQCAWNTYQNRAHATP